MVLAIGSLAILGFLFFPQNEGRKPKAQLKVLTYSSFVGALGPGRIIKQKFELFCDCRLIWFLTEDSTALGPNFDLIPGIDIVIGWDQISLLSAPRGKWQDLSELKKQNLPHFYQENFYQKEGAMPSSFAGLLQNPYFLPLDWSPIGFIYRDPEFNIVSLKDLSKIKGKISFPEPRSSTLGLQFYYWIYEWLEGDKGKIAGFLQKLKFKARGPVFSWSLAYGFFQKRRADMGLAYLSSLLYHQKEDEGQGVFFARFVEGHPFQMEFASIALESKNKDTALAFARFLLSPETQKLIKQTHYMLGVAQKRDLPPSLEGVKLISYKRMNEFMAQKKDLLNLWETKRQ